MAKIIPQHLLKDLGLRKRFDGLGNFTGYENEAGRLFRTFKEFQDESGWTDKELGLTKRKKIKKVV
jgi:hypothetical protein